MQIIIPIIELVILFLFFYLILLSLRGTRGAGIIKGLFFIFIITLLVAITATRVFKLEVIHYILQNWLPQILLVALIIIFHPELRNSLMRLGQSRLFQPIFKQQTVILDEIVDAVIKMAKRKIGALIAIEREVGLKQYIDGGIKIDAEVTSELLQNIFFPKSPLHDGAVIIKEERIAAAGCLFPLSDNPDIAKSFGTRHRSAIGITEESDAISIIVSEQTGRISVGMKGNLNTDLDKDSLRKILTDLYLNKNQANAEPVKQNTGLDAKNQPNAAEQVKITES
jgi:diadenylate cyclase